MKIFRRTLALVVVCLSAAPAVASDIDVVRAFYTDILSQAGSPVLAERVVKVVHKDWVNTPAPRGKSAVHRENFINSIGYLGKAIPDLKWEIKEILQDGNRYIVRGEGSGTPVKKLFGIEPVGNSFRIMSIDIHTVENGSIVRSFHVEPWHVAMKQLRGK